MKFLNYNQTHSIPLYMFIWRVMFVWCEGLNHEVCPSILETPCVLRTLYNEVRSALFWSTWAEQRCVMQCLMTIAPVKYSHQVMFVFDTPMFPVKKWLIATRKAHSEMCLIKVHTTERSTLSRSWKKTPIVIRRSVSKFYVTLWGAAANWGLEWLFVEVPTTDTLLDTQAHTAGLRMCEQLVA